MADKRSSSIFLATAMLLFTAVAVEAQMRNFVVNPFCRTSDYKRMCSRMVRGATNQNQASANAMTSTLVLARHARAMVFLLKPAIGQLEPQSQSSLMTTCTEHFDSTVSDLEDSLEALKKNDIGSLRSKLSAATRTDCDDELKQFSVQSPPIKRLTSLLQKMVDNCLAVVMQN